MAKRAQWVIDYCNSILIDEDGARWGESWLKFINSGQLLIADIFPAATSKTEVVQLAPGVEQSCPSGAIVFLGMTCNMGDDGVTPGAAIAVCEEEFLSAFSPGWMGVTASAQVENYMFDENQPTSFRVSPPVPSDVDVYAGVRYSAIPADCLSPNSLLSIADKYVAALGEWCMYLALSAETDSADPGKAQSHLTNFFNLLGVKKENRVTYSPNVRERGGHPPIEAQ